MIDANELPSKDIVPHTHNGQIIPQRAADGYINATAMCRAIGKEWSNYRKNDTSEAFLIALEGSLLIRRDLLIRTVATGPNDRRGTWVHPQIAINLATWLSPDFAVQVSEWVISWMMGIAQRRPPLPDFQTLNEDEKRLYLRDQVASSNKKLADAARGSGVVTPQDFSIFQSHGYRGMYDGRSVDQIRSVKGLAKSAPILDHMGSAELAANLFRITQTEEKLVKERAPNKFAANTAHYEVGKKVRQAMIEISGIPPERLPVAPDVKKLQRRIAREQIAKPPPEEGVQTIKYDEVSDSHAESKIGRKIDLRTDLWKYALLVIATRSNGEITTSDLLEELHEYIHVPSEVQETLVGRSDNKFSQLVRNLKSHKTTKNNFIYQGYAEDIPGGFRITQKGRDFIEAYFA